MTERYKDLYDNYTWNIPENFNIAEAICDRHAKGNDTALVYEDEDGKICSYTFRDLKRLSNQLSNAYKHLGIEKGDRIGIFLSQQPETLIAHLAGFKSGAINIPLFTLFGPEALEFRLNNSEAKIVLVDNDNLEKLIDIKGRLSHLESIICINGQKDDQNGIVGFSELLENASDNFKTVKTSPEDPALIIYTSGTTGPPKGALLAHRVLLGHMPGVEVSHNFFPQPGDFFWTPADWAWIGGLIDVLLPSLYHKTPVLACRFKKFSPQQAINLMLRHGVRNVFFPPTALKMIRAADPPDLEKLNLRTLASGGESLGEEILEWGRERFEIEINEFYGQTEANLLVSNCSAIMEVKPGSMGRAVPGHRVAVIDGNGNELPPGSEGEFAVRRPDPVMFLGYWRKEDATRDKFIGEWMTTGDTGSMDEEGYFYFKGRNDDVIIYAGYRIGPAEVENCLLQHPAVSLSAVIGRPDAMRGEIVKAFIVLNEGKMASEELKKNIQDFVKTRLAAHEYPREIEFIEEIPLTLTGKVKRNELRARET